MTRLRCGRDLLAGDLTFPGAGRITILAPEPHPLRRQAGSSNDSSESSRPRIRSHCARSWLAIRSSSSSSYQLAFGSAWN